MQQQRIALPLSVSLTGNFAPQSRLKRQETGVCTVPRVSLGRRSDAHRVCARSAGHGEEASKCQGRRRAPAVDGGPGIRPRRISVVPFPARRAREPPRLILSSRLSSSAASAQGRVETSHALRGRYKPTNAVFPKITTPRSYFQHPSSKRIDRTCLPGGDLACFCAA